jgi:CelD/BcsL family acetyltransferase involved in cellulose biosynthesis
MHFTAAAKRAEAKDPGKGMSPPGGTPRSAAPSGHTATDSGERPVEIRRWPVEKGRWSVETRRDESALAELGEELRDLYQRSPAATPFQAHQWLAAWWDSYGTPGRLRLILVRCDGRLVAAAALMSSRRWGFPVLLPLAEAQSDFADFLLDPAYEEDAIRNLRRALLDEPGWCALDLREVRPGSVAHAVAERWPRRTWRMPASICFEIPVTDLTELFARLSGRAAKKMRAKLRKIDASGITVEPVPAEQAAQAVHTLLDLHEQQWRDRSINPEHTRDRFRRHLAAAMSGLIHDGQAAMFQYRQDGRVLASNALVVGHRFLGAYLYGAAPELRTMVDISLVFMRQDLMVGLERDLPAVSFLRGEEPYKLKWRPQPVRNERLILGRSAAAIAFAGVARARLAARRYVRGDTGASQQTPRRPGIEAHG